MSRNWRAGLGKMAIAFFLGGITVPCGYSIVLAQIIPDETLGAESSVVTPDNIKGLESDRISGGAVRGSNLFHSFREFNIGEGKGGYFESRAAIENIFSRVTGSNPSNILGTLGVLGNANLFFLNPNGIIFGENASLDLNGSFLATTADSIVFPDGKQFSGTNPEAPPLLTVNVQQPIGLEFEGREGIISHQGLLAVEPGQNLALVGGDVTLDGGSLIAPGGRVELGGLSAAGEIDINADGSLSFPDGVARGDVSLSNGTFVDVSADGGGDITVNARNLELSGRSTLLAGIGRGLGTANAQAGDIKINATSVFLSGGSQLSSDIKGRGNGGNAIIDATNRVSFDGLESGIFARVFDEVEDRGSNINIKTRNFALTNGAQLITTTLGKGDAGSVTIDATDSIFFDGISSVVRSNVGETGLGNAGSINISSKKLFLANDAQLRADTFGQGDGGRVSIQATDSVKVSGADIFSDTGENAKGKAGNITIETGSLELINGARLGTRTAGRVDAGSIEIRTGTLSVINEGRLLAMTRGEGNGGNITINATDKVFFDGMGKDELFTGASTEVLEGAEGNAGQIDITTKILSLTNDALLFATTNGQGDGGQVSIQATDSFKISGADIFNDTGENASGKAGSIAINTGSLELTNGARLRTSTAGKVDAGSIAINTGSLSVVNNSRLQAFTSGEGNGGNITINATDRVFFDGLGKGKLFNAVSTDVLKRAEGNGGSIKIMTSSLKLVDQAQVTASTSGVGNAGDVTLTVEENITLTGTGSGIFANTSRGSSGNGGSIKINPNTVVIRNGAQIAVNSDGIGVGGNIDLQAGSLTLDRGTITAETTSNQGGDINLTLSDLLTLRNNSQITSTAGTAQAGGDGGNITINAPFLIAFPSQDSNITANAFEGDGGNITVDTNGIFGIEFRDQETDLNDITASSEFGQPGEVEINTSAIDPTRGLNNLPQEAVEAEVAQGCQTAGGKPTLEFFDIGRGGLPPTPEDLFSSEVVIAEWIPLDFADEKLPQQTLEESFTEEDITNLTLLTNLSCRRN